MASLPGNKPRKGPQNNKRKPSAPVLAQQPTVTVNAPPAWTNGNAAQAPAKNSVMRDRLLFALMGLVGSQCIATTKQGIRVQGILTSTTTELDLSVALSRAKRLDKEDAPVQNVLVIMAKDLVQIEVTSVDLEAQTAPAIQGARGPETSFRTDTEITGMFDGSDGRQLMRWSDEVVAIAGTSSLDSSKKAWDQFETNERLFGTRTNYDEELYTTKLDRSGKDFQDKERRAAALAQEILGTSTNNPHLAEERNQITQTAKELDEEDKYSGVIRGPNAYIPPGARKQTAVNQEHVTPPTDPIANGASSASHTIESKSTNPAGAKTNDALLGDFKSFVSDELKRLGPKRQIAVKKDKEDKLAELKAWSASFSLKTPFPADILPMVAKDKAKQDQLLATRSPPVTAVNSFKPLQELGKTSASTATTPHLKEPKLATSRFASPVPGFSTTKSADSSSRIVLIPEIPTYEQLKARKVALAEAANGKKIEDWKSRVISPAPSTSSTGTGKINATAKEFVPNPNAISFTPNAQSPVQRQPPLSTPTHPFFGIKSIKKGLPNMHIKEEFSPLKAQSTPDPASVSPNWQFTGKSYKAIFPYAASPIPPPSEDLDSRSQSSGLPSGAATPLPAGGIAPLSAFSPAQANHLMSPNGQSPYQYYYPQNMGGFRPPNMPYGPPFPGQQYMAFSPGSQPGMYPQQAPPPQFVQQGNFPQGIQRHPSMGGIPGQPMPQQMYFGGNRPNQPKMMMTPMPGAPTMQVQSTFQSQNGG